MHYLPELNLPFFVILLLLIILAKTFGEIMERFNQPAMIGEILAGFILGPTLLNWVNPTQELKTIADLGVFFLIVLAGMEIDMDEISKNIRGRNFRIGITGFIIPFVLGFATGLLFGLDITHILFLALCISITALPVSVRILMDLGRLQTSVGQSIITAAIFNNIISFLILGVILQYRAAGSNETHIALSIGSSLLKFILFAGIVMLSYYLFARIRDRSPRFSRELEKFADSLKIREAVFAIVMVFVLIFAGISEMLGLQFVIGAFFGALILSRDLLGPKIFKKVNDTASGITMGFLAPVFFAYIGIEFNVFAINDIWLLVTVVAVSFAGKILGGYTGGRMSGYDRLESVTLGIGLNARGMVELVIANIALKNGFIGIPFFSILVVMGITTTLISPFLLKIYFSKTDLNHYRKIAIKHD